MAEMNISIHALLAESDMQDYATSADVELISIHALLAESDFERRTGQEIPNNFYPRSPCGERPVYQVQSHFMGLISIHALLAESDLGFGKKDVTQK